MVLALRTASIVWYSEPYRRIMDKLIRPLRQIQVFSLSLICFTIPSMFRTIGSLSRILSWLMCCCNLLAVYDNWPYWSKLKYTVTHISVNLDACVTSVSALVFKILFFFFCSCRPTVELDLSVVWSLALHRHCYLWGKTLFSHCWYMCIKIYLYYSSLQCIVFKYFVYCYLWKNFFTLLIYMY